MWITALFGIDLGTQPGELSKPVETVEHCELCHAGFANSAVDAWEGTMMANAVDDPLFLAGLTIANQDIPGIGDFCLRCHTPPGWLEGRCTPGDVSSLIPTDYEGIQCDFCHRMTEGPAGPAIGNAVYTVADDEAKRGTYEANADHDVIVDPYFESSELCGTCHEVSNPLFQDFPIERTYSEWKASAFADPGGESCQDCHMPAEIGYAAVGIGIPSRTVHVHRFVGGNTFIPRVLAGERPDLGRAEAFLAAEQAARALLEEAAIVSVETSALYRGSIGTVYVKVENLGGHKLPTGYPEGRRAWLEVTVRDADGTEFVRSGVYDPVQARLLADSSLRTYEAKLGANGAQSYHMVQQNEVLFDGRIPPRGFRPTPDLAPVGRTFDTMPDGSMAHYDRAPYLIDVPLTAKGPLTVEAKLWYQTTTREFVEFLRDENVTDATGQQMYDLWVAYDKDPPELMASAIDQIILFDAEEEDLRACGCAGGPAPRSALLAGTLGWLGLRRGRNRSHGVQAGTVAERPPAECCHTFHSVGPNVSPSAGRACATFLGGGWVELDRRVGWRTLELGMVAATALIFLALPKPPEAVLPLAVFIVTCGVGWTAYGVSRLRRAPSMWKEWGLLPTAHLRPIARVLVPVSGAAVALGAGVALALGRPLVPNLLWLSLLLYPAWGLLQQWLVQALVVDNVRVLFGLREPSLVVLGAVGFGAVHTSHPPLVLATALLGALYVALFQRWPNLWPLAIAHGWLGSLFYPWILGINPIEDLIGLLP